MNIAKVVFTADQIKARVFLDDGSELRNVTAVSCRAEANDVVRVSIDVCFMHSKDSIGQIGGEGQKVR